MANNLDRIQSAIVDGRSRTPRYIQKQLTVLHDALVKSVSAIHQAIIRDTGCSSSEAWFEISATIKAVKQEFTSISFEDSLRNEYSLAHGKDNRGRRTPFGCAYIIPSSHSRLYSIAQPVAASIAAGNCVVIEMHQTLLETERQLRQILGQVMDRDTFAIVDQRPAQDKFFTEQVIVIDGSSEQEGPKLSRSTVLKSSNARTLAVVDRSANIAEAAKHIVRARLQFSGKSPYAPDVLLVNEFAMKDFCRAAIQAFTEGISESVNGNSPNKPRKAGSSSKESQQQGITTLVSGARGSIQLSQSRDQKTMNKKINEPVLTIYPITSLDDAIDTANSGEGVPLAAYFFADPKAAKYLSQFVDADISFTNQIPTQLLVGPAAPRGHTASIAARYTKEMLSFSSPEYISSAADEVNLSQLLDGQLPKADLEKLKAEVKAPLPDMKEPEGKSVGFFEQGLFTGLATEATIAVSVIAVCAKYAVPAVMKRVRA